MNQIQQTLSTPAPSRYLPQPGNLETRVADITALWYLAVERGKDVETQARKIFAEHPGARSDESASREAQKALRELLGLEVCTEPPAEPDLPPFEPVPASRQAAPAAAAVEDDLLPSEDEPSDAAQTPELDDAGENAPEDDGGDDHGAAEEARVDPSEAEQVPVSAAGGGDPTAWPEGVLGDGLISGLARTLAVGEAVQLVLSRTAAGQLLATVVPQRLNGELAGTCKELQAKGTPHQLDEEFVAAMATYREVRRTAREVAEELLAAAKAAAAGAKAAANKAAEASRKKAEEARAAQQASQQATLTVTVNTPGAIISVRSDKATLTPEAGKGQKLDAGRYAVRVEAPGHEPHEESVLVKAKETKTLTVTLKPILQGLF